jgi:hypothetical protein
VIEEPVMKATRVDIKLFADKGSHVEGEQVLKAFHGFIQQTKIKDELILDVTSYEHVKEGPGIMLIGHEGMYGLDEAKGRLGLLYSQRRANVDSFEAALSYTLQHALTACSLIEQDATIGGKLRFGGDEILIRINDRLNAPVSPETWQAVEPAVRKVLGRVLGEDVSFTVHDDPRELFSVTARAKKPERVDALLGRMSA